jgi:hypothetical protein
MIDRLLGKIEERFVWGPKEKQPVWKIVRRPDLERNLRRQQHQAAESGNESLAQHLGYLASLVQEGGLYGAIDNIKAYAVAKSPRNLSGQELQKATDEIKRKELSGLISDYREAGIDLSPDQVKRVEEYALGKHNYIT